MEKERVPPSAKVEYRTTLRGRKYLKTYSALLKMLHEEGSMERARYARTSGEA